MAIRVHPDDVPEWSVLYGAVPREADYGLADDEDWCTCHDRPPGLGCCRFRVRRVGAGVKTTPVVG